MRKIRIDFNTRDLEEKIQTARKILKEDKEEGKNFEFDLTKLNFIDAAKAALLLSSEALNLNSKTRIECFVKDDEAKNFISRGKLKNTLFSVNVSSIKDIGKIKQLKTGSGI